MALQQGAAGNVRTTTMEAFNEAEYRRVRGLGRLSYPRGDAEINLLHLRVVLQHFCAGLRARCGRSGAHRRSRRSRARAGRLLGEQQGQPLLVQLLERVVELIDDGRREAEARLVEQQQLGSLISARPSASICRSPPDSVPASCCALGEPREQREHAIEQRRQRALSGAGSRRAAGSARPSGDEQPPALGREREAFRHDRIGRLAADLLVRATRSCRGSGAPGPRSRSSVVVLPAPFEPSSATMSPTAHQATRRRCRSDRRSAPREFARRSAIPVTFVSLRHQQPCRCPRPRYASITASSLTTSPARPWRSRGPG